MFVPILSHLTFESSGWILKAADSEYELLTETQYETKTKKTYSIYIQVTGVIAWTSLLHIQILNNHKQTLSLT